MSDADILVVVKDRSGKVPEQIVRDFVRFWTRHRTPTISWYGQKRLQNMFRNGHLFAWHLYAESRSIWGATNIEEVFGRPGPYLDAVLDISSFQTVIDSVPTALKQSPRNVIYEMGLLYVCVRNIAMSASWHLCSKPDFTRYSPFNLHSAQPSISLDDYELTMSCRMASQRGSRISRDIRLDKALDIQQSISNWSKIVKEEVISNERK